MCRIARHRQVPRHIKSSKAEIRSIKVSGELSRGRTNEVLSVQESSKRKEANRRKHSKPGAVPHLPERDAHTIEEME